MKYFIPFLLAVFMAFTFSAAADDITVIMNTHSKIYHFSDCQMASKCTKNCVKMTKEEAIAQQGKLCKLCQKKHKNEL